MGHSNQPLVLVVEDEPFVRMIAAEGLEDAGFEVLEADSADAALRILNSRSDVRVLFTDINMPGSVDGVELARLVHERWPELRIVITSGREQPAAAEIPDDGRFVPKPYRPREVAHVIEELIG
ncbi:MAG: response regulator receiver [Caulobacteraceae bacterium]|nr:response regulator receiver [Caulobacteraceae bacterium]